MPQRRPCCISVNAFKCKDIDKLFTSLNARGWKTGRFAKFEEKIRQLGSYGGGNHFGECEAVQIENDDRARRAASVTSLRTTSSARCSRASRNGAFPCPAETANWFTRRSAARKRTHTRTTWRSARTSRR